MKTMKSIAIAILLFGAGVCGTASAHGHSHAHVGVFIGAPIGPWYYPPAYYAPYPYYAYPPVVVAQPSQPPVYVEQSAAPTASALEPGYWYYCHHPEGYYPYIKDCPAGWQKVPPSTK